MSSVDYFIYLAIGLFTVQVVNLQFGGTGVCQIPFSVHVSRIPSHDDEDPFSKTSGTLNSIQIVGF